MKRWSYTLMAIFTATAAMQEAQKVLQNDDMGWKVDLSRQWKVLGPFPLHAREQHFLSPSFPLNLSDPAESWDRTWPSAYADGGEVGWSEASAAENGELLVSFPEIRWSALRATEGWAALQHHSVLQATVIVTPPTDSLADLPQSEAEARRNPPRLSVELKQGSFFALRPKDAGAGFVPTWYAGNIYAMAHSPPQVVQLPSTPSPTEPTVYDLFVSGDYEIRLFGDPASYNSEVPVLSVNMAVDIFQPQLHLQHDPEHNVLCDFVGGWALGRGIGIGVRNADADFKTVVGVTMDKIEGLGVALPFSVRVAPAQMRIIPIKLVQTGPFLGKEIALELLLKDGNSMKISLPIRQRDRLQSGRGTDDGPLQVTYLIRDSTPTAFQAIPPAEPNDGESLPPIIALHGAGVDIFEFDFWPASLPRRQRQWVISPSGRTPWGLDWHGPSSQDVWTSLEALSDILHGSERWKIWGFPRNSKAVLIGHSNGGQGTWWNAVHYPDRVLAAVPAAGYIKSQAYIPLTMSRSAHFIDPMLRAVLETSLTPDDNDLFMSNLHQIPILAIHGGKDDNVPTWHTRQLVDIVKAQANDANISFKEDAGKPHWYPEVLDNSAVQSFLDHVSGDDLGRKSTVCQYAFTLTVGSPTEFDTMCGWKIETLKHPGRLASLTVEVDASSGMMRMSSRNVKSLSYAPVQYPKSGVAVSLDGDDVQLDEQRKLATLSDLTGHWESAAPSDNLKLLQQPSGRAQVFVTSSKGPIIIAVPDDEGHRAWSGAHRIAHDLHVYHRIDSEIVTHWELLERIGHRTNGEGNVLVLGSPTDRLIFYMLNGQPRTPWTATREGVLSFDGRPVAQSDGALFLHPHPSRPDISFMLMVANDDAAMERLIRLFPIRTGVTVPDWLILNPQVDRQGAAGVVAAGLWASGWSYSPVASYVPW